MALLVLSLMGCPRDPMPPVDAPNVDRASAPVLVTLTFDDLPYQTRRGGKPLEPDAAKQFAVNERMLAALGTVKATAFVNCGNLDDSALVTRWREAGHAIGNHTAHHMSAADGDLEAWVADVRACDGLWPADDPAPRWFRFPYLWRGNTAERRDAVADALAASGYRTVPVTVDSHDWAYEFARARHPESLSELAAMLAANVADALAESRAVAREKLGRETAQIVLLHVNAVTAEALPEILVAMSRDGAVLAPVHEVLADPLYAESDAWAGPGARMWLARTAPTERPDGSPWYRDREETVRAALAAWFED